MTMRIEYFQLVDRIVELDLAGRTIKTQAQVPHTSTIFEGHFPGHPLMPGVLLTEAMAQTSGWLIIGVTGFSRMPFLASVKEAKLRTFVSPGQVLSMRACLLHDGSGYAMTKAAIDVDGKTVADAEITFRVMAFPDPKFRTSMGEVAQRIGFPVEASGHG
jgi:3-hydroxyacyl-[acyl-carrier-protein] dehydratase